MKRMLGISAFLSFILSCGFVFAEPLTQSQIEEAVGRVNTVALNRRGGIVGYSGSGIVFGETDKNYYMLTNAHVVESGIEYSVDFFKDGEKYHTVKANLFWEAMRHQSGVDFAVLSISKKEFEDYSKPRVVPLVPVGTKVEEGQRVYASGFPFAGSIDYWEGTVTNVDGPWINFRPRPDSGESGSGMLTDYTDENGELQTGIVGLVTLQSMHDGPSGYGSAGSVKNLRRQFR